MTSTQIQQKDKNGFGQRQILPQLEHDIGQTVDGDKAGAFRTAPVLAVFRDCGKTTLWNKHHGLYVCFLGHCGWLSGALRVEYYSKARRE